MERKRREHAVDEENEGQCLFRVGLEESVWMVIENGIYNYLFQWIKIVICISKDYKLENFSPSH